MGLIQLTNEEPPIIWIVNHQVIFTCIFISTQRMYHVLTALFSTRLCTQMSFRSSHRSCSVRKGVLKDFAKYREKHLCQGLFFNKFVGLRPATLLKKRLWHRCFPVNFAKFLLQNTSWQLLMELILLDFKTIISIYLIGHYTSRNRAPPNNTTESKIKYWYQCELHNLPSTFQNVSMIASDVLILTKKALIGKHTLDAPNLAFSHAW